MAKDESQPRLSESGSASVDSSCNVNERFGKPERIIFAHIQPLLGVALPTKIAPGSSKHTLSLWKLQDELLTHVRSLEALGVDGKQYGREIERRERSDTFKDIHPGKSDDRFVESEKRGHKSENCNAILKLSVADWEEAIRSAKLCFRCLGKGHFSRGCPAKCVKCKGRHNVLCFTGTKSNANESSPNEQAAGTSGSSVTNPTKNVTHCGVTHCESNPNNNLLSQTCNVLQTAKVKVWGEKGMYQAIVLFDTGSDRPYVSCKFVKKVQPRWVTNECISYSSFGGGKTSKGNQCNVYDLNLIDIKGESHSLLASEIPDICAPLFRPSVPDVKIKHFSSLQLADDYMNSRHVNVDILVGLDAYWKFMLPNKYVQYENLVAQESLFGWILSGSCNESFDKGNVNSQLLCINVSESALNNFWDLESMGICTKEAVSKDSTLSNVMSTFSETVKFNDDRYAVALPWKSDVAKQRLQNNEKLARKKLDNLNVKLEKCPDLRRRYDEVFKEYERDCIIEEVPPSEMVTSYPVYYLPHRPVVRESSNSTKVRPVFDASAVGYNGISLNDCLECGPSLNPDLVGVLIRFRRWKVALMADITKAFLQIKVRREDQDVHRFLRNCNGTVRIIRFVRVPFGNKSSPFLLNATIKTHLKNYPHSKVVNKLYNNLYVDDWLSGADSDAEACVKFNEANKIMAEAGMSLSRWNSNSKALREKFLEIFELYGEVNL
ncbi:uncharacterized protein [Palaemon carinicauda]|uniref:uncharacterized protein n=1 Tax=Palaemon carinicauda TaxID=392227 RepID=UPI0035B6874E